MIPDEALNLIFSPCENLYWHWPFFCAQITLSSLLWGGSLLVHFKSPIGTGGGAHLSETVGFVVSTKLWVVGQDLSLFHSYVSPVTFWVLLIVVLSTPYPWLYGAQFATNWATWNLWCCCLRSTILSQAPWIRSFAGGVVWLHGRGGMGWWCRLYSMPAFRGAASSWPAHSRGTLLSSLGDVHYPASSSRRTSEIKCVWAIPLQQWPYYWVWYAQCLAYSCKYCHRRGGMVFFFSPFHPKTLNEGAPSLMLEFPAW